MIGFNLDLDTAQLEQFIVIFMLLFYSVTLFRDDDSSLHTLLSYHAPLLSVDYRIYNMPYVFECAFNEKNSHIWMPEFASLA